MGLLKALLSGPRRYVVEASYHQVALTWNSWEGSWHSEENALEFAKTVVCVCQLPLCHTFMRLLNRAVPDLSAAPIGPRLTGLPAAVNLYNVLEVCERHEGSDLFYYFKPHVRGEFEAAQRELALPPLVSLGDLQGLAPASKLTIDEIRAMGGFPFT